MTIEKCDVELRMAEAVAKMPGLVFYPSDRDAVSKLATESCWSHLQLGGDPDACMADPRTFVRGAITTLGLDEKVRSRGGY